MPHKVAVIIPTYNSYEVTINLIEALRNQTFKYFDIIIVDDGSDDWKYIKEYMQKKKSERYIRILRLKRNMGPGSAFKAGIEFVWMPVGFAYPARLVSNNF